ncbi:hypothetical protein WR25_01327 [Diploscapter pachys]|uniref:Uncharacterized protein n=1 Tax=Diploscapter pachys TaxID=2018661 RepID=A0A2A2JA48_9BILA|nr:hypothetical protein WR25_01327 [Diploscapter pachys]
MSSRNSVSRARTFQFVYDGVGDTWEMTISSMEQPVLIEKPREYNDEPARRLFSFSGYISAPDAYYVPKPFTEKRFWELEIKRAMAYASKWTQMLKVFESAKIKQEERFFVANIKQHVERWEYMATFGEEAMCTGKPPPIELYHSRREELMTLEVTMESGVRKSDSAKKQTLQLAPYISDLDLAAIRATHPVGKREWSRKPIVNPALSSSVTESSSVKPSRAESRLNVSGRSSGLKDSDTSNTTLPTVTPDPQENRPESSASVISLGSDSAESVQENGKVQEKRDGEEPDEDDLYCDQLNDTVSATSRLDELEAEIGQKASKQNQSATRQKPKRRSKNKDDSYIYRNKKKPSKKAASSTYDVTATSRSGRQEIHLFFSKFETALGKRVKQRQLEEYVDEDDFAMQELDDDEQEDMEDEPEEKQPRRRRGRPRKVSRPWDIDSDDADFIEPYQHKLKSKEKPIESKSATGEVEKAERDEASDSKAKEVAKRPKQRKSDFNTRSKRKSRVIDSDYEPVDENLMIRKEKDDVPVDQQQKCFQEKMGTFINSTPSGRTSLAERNGPSQAKESAGNEEDSEGSEYDEEDENGPTTLPPNFDQLPKDEQRRIKRRINHRQRKEQKLNKKAEAWEVRTLREVEGRFRGKTNDIYDLLTHYMWINTTIHNLSENPFCANMSSIKKQADLILIYLHKNVKVDLRKCVQELLAASESVVKTVGPNIPLPIGPPPAVKELTHYPELFDLNDFPWLQDEADEEDKKARSESPKTAAPLPAPSAPLSTTQTSTVQPSQPSSSGTSTQPDASATPTVQLTPQPPAAIDLSLAYTLPLAGLTGQIQANSTIPGAPNPFTVPIQLTQQQLLQLSSLQLYPQIGGVNYAYLPQLMQYMQNPMLQFALPTSAATASTSTTSAGITPVVTPTIQPSIPPITPAVPTPIAPTPIRPEPRQPTTSKTQAEQVKPKPLKKKKKDVEKSVLNILQSVSSQIEEEVGKQQEKSRTPERRATGGEAAQKKRKSTTGDGKVKKRARKEKIESESDSDE